MFGWMTKWLTGWGLIRFFAEAAEGGGSATVMDESADGPDGEDDNVEIDRDEDQGAAAYDYEEPGPEPTDQKTDTGVDGKDSHADADKEKSKDAAGEEDTDQDAIGDDLIAQAGQFGITPDQARAFSNKTSLMIAMGIISSRLGQPVREPAVTPGAVPGRTVTQPVQQRPTAQPAAGQEQPDPLDEFRLKLELDEEAIEPEAVKAIKAINDHYAGQLRESRLLVDEVVGYLQNEKNQSFYREFDSAIEALGEEFVDVFGTGTGDELDPNSKELANRRAAIAGIEGLKQVLATGKQRIPSVKKLVEQVAHGLYPGKAEKKVRKELEGGIKKRSRLALGEPQGRKGKLPAADEAARIINEHLEAAGITPATSVYDDTI